MIASGTNTCPHCSRETPWPFRCEDHKTIEKAKNLHERRPTSPESAALMKRLDEHMGAPQTSAARRIDNLRRIAADESVNNFARSICGEAAEHLAVQSESERRDAARYQWLKSLMKEDSEGWSFPGIKGAPSLETVDQVIDATLESQ